MQQFPGKFSSDYEANKKFLSEHAIFRSKLLRNEVAGYITRHFKLLEEEAEEQTEGGCFNQLNSGRVVSHAGFRLELSILRLEELLPHEETIPESVLKLKQNLIEDGVQRDPIIIDSRTLTILDGMHRHRALTELSAKLGVVCRVDYSDSRVKVKRWLRSAKFDDKRVSELSKTTGLRISMSRDEAIRLVDSRASVAALVRGRKALASLTAGGPFDSFSVVRSFDEYCKRSNIPVSIQTDD